MIEVDLMLSARPLGEIAPLARAAQDAGFGALWLTEAGHDPFLAAAQALSATDRLVVGTAIALAFPRSPMITAVSAWDLAELSGGRFVLGLGTQVRAHIKRRYSAEFNPPGPRMRDYLGALRAIFAAFRGAPLDYRSEHYTHTLLPPIWSPGPIDAPDPPLYVSAVGPYLCRLAGRLGDGVHVHPFHSLTHLRAEQLPAVAAGAQAAGASLAARTIVVPVMTASGSARAELAESRDRARTMVAFYGSTKNYARVFEAEGFDGLSETLQRAQRAGDVGAMRAAITDEVLDRYVVSAPWGELADALLDRYAGLVPRLRLVSYSASEQLRHDPRALDRWAAVVAALRSAITSEPAGHGSAG